MNSSSESSNRTKKVDPEDYPAVVSIVLIGPPGSGKTAFRRAVLHQPFSHVYKKGFLSKHETYMHIDDVSVSVDLWDATEDSWPAISQLIPHVVIVCLDISDPLSLDKVIKSQYYSDLIARKWDVPLIFAACKDDLRSTEPAKTLLSMTKCENWAENEQLTYTECSSKNNDIRSVMRIVGILIKANKERRDYNRTPMMKYGYKTELVRGLSEMSMAKAIRHVFQAYSDRIALGERMYDKQGEKLLRYRWTTYAQLGERVVKFGTAIKTLIPPRSFVCVCAENSISWIVADLALQAQNMVTVMLHYTLPDEDIDYVVEHSELDAVVTTPRLLKAFSKAASVNPKLKLIIIQLPNDPKSRELRSSQPAFYMNLIEECRKISPKTQFITQEQLENMGNDLPDSFEESKDPNEVFSISYTSGSTGRPKGIMMSSESHRKDFLFETMSPSVGLVFEPLSHSERVNTYAKLCGGGRVVLFNGEMHELIEELQICRPTVFIAVPRFWNVLYGEFNKIVALYRKCMPEKGPRSAQSLARALFEALMGGRITYAATGGAPTSPAVLSWMYGFSFVVSESYGSMEVGGITTSKKLAPDLNFKLIDVPEMGYTTKDKPFPRGELCIKSQTMFSGYHNNEAETKEAFIEGGYFRTGDIVQLEGPENVRIIDRKKFIFKLAQGEYVSPAKAEGVYVKSKFISQIMAYGNSLQSYLVAIVVPNENILQSWATTHNIGLTFEQLCSAPEIKDLILTEMRNCEVMAQLRPYEKVRDILIVNEKFTPENGLLTATSKLNRRAILNKYKNQLDGLYEHKLDEIGSTSGQGQHSPNTRSSSDEEALKTLKQLVAKSLPALSSGSTLNPTSNLVSAGLDSMSALKLVKTIQKEMQVSLPISSLYQPGMTIESLSQVVSHQKGTVEYLRDTENTMFEEEISPDLDTDPYNWFSELLPPHKSSNQKSLEEKAMINVQKSFKIKVEEELINALKTKTLQHMPSTQTNNESNTNPSNKKNSDVKMSKRSGAYLFERVQVSDILLTGATGFLGLYLLHEILTQFPQATVYCIIRASSEPDAWNKLKKSIRFACLDKLDLEMVPDVGSKYARIKVLVGDLSIDKFGLDDKTWNFMCDTIDSIYHCAAWVNGLFPYQILRNANVLSTVQLLKMALTGQKNRKIFNFVSTLSSLSRSNHWTPELCISPSAKLFGFDGYPLTKRVCEMLIGNLETLIPDLPVVVYRPGSIVGHSQSGHVNIEAFIHKLICGLIQLESYPTSNKWTFNMDWAPVDFVAKTIVHISKSGGSQTAPRRYNVCNPYSCYSMNMNRLATYIQEYGYTLNPQPFRQWRRELYTQFDSRPGYNTLEPLRSYFEDGFPEDGRFECQSTLKSLKPLKHRKFMNDTSGSSMSNIQDMAESKEEEKLPESDQDKSEVPFAICRPISREIVHNMIKFCIEKEYIAPPRRLSL